MSSSPPSRLLDSSFNAFTPDHGLNGHSLTSSFTPAASISLTDRWSPTSAWEPSDSSTTWVSQPPRLFEPSQTSFNSASIPGGHSLGVNTQFTTAEVSAAFAPAQPSFFNAASYMEAVSYQQQPHPRFVFCSGQEGFAASQLMFDVPDTLTAFNTAVSHPVSQSHTPMKVETAPAAAVSFVAQQDPLNELTAQFSSAPTSRVDASQMFSPLLLDAGQLRSSSLQHVQQPTSSLLPALTSAASKPSGSVSLGFFDPLHSPPTTWAWAANIEGGLYLPRMTTRFKGIDSDCGTYDGVGVVNGLVSGLQYVGGNGQKMSCVTVAPSKTTSGSGATSVGLSGTYCTDDSLTFCVDLNAEIGPVYVSGLVCVTPPL